MKVNELMPGDYVAVFGETAKAIPDGFKFGEKVKVIIIKEAKK